MAHQEYVTALELCRWHNEHSKRNSQPPLAHRSQLSLAWDPRSSPPSPAQSHVQSQTFSRRGKSNVDLSWSDDLRSTPSTASTRPTASRKNHTTADFTTNFEWQVSPTRSAKEDTLRGRPERFLKRSSSNYESYSRPESSCVASSVPATPEEYRREGKPYFRSPLDSRISPTTAAERDGYLMTPESAQLECYSYVGSDEESIVSESVASEHEHHRRRRHRAPLESTSPQEESLVSQSAASEHGHHRRQRHRAPLESPSPLEESIPSPSIASSIGEHYRRQRSSVTDSPVSRMRSSPTESQFSQSQSASLSAPVGRPRPGTPGVIPLSKGNRAPKGYTPSMASSCSQLSRPSSSIAMPARVAPGGELVPSANVAVEKTQKLPSKPSQRGYRTDFPLPQQLGTPSRVPNDARSVQSERSARGSSVDAGQRRKASGRNGSAASSCSGSETERSSLYWEGSTAPTRSSCVETSFAQPVSC